MADRLLQRGIVPLLQYRVQQRCVLRQSHASVEQRRVTVASRRASPSTVHTASTLSTMHRPPAAFRLPQNREASSGGTEKRPRAEKYTPFSPRSALNHGDREPSTLGNLLYSAGKEACASASSVPPGQYRIEARAGADFDSQADETISPVRRSHPETTPVLDLLTSGREL